MTNNKSFIRWQEISIKQLSFTNNLIIVLAISLLGFVIPYIQEDDVVLNKWQKFLFWFGVLSNLSSLTLGICVVIYRLEDFRLTAKIARKRETNNREGINEDRIIAKELGSQTWNLFIWQIATFSVCFLLFLILIVIELSDKIL